MTYSPASAVWFCAYDMAKPLLRSWRPYLRQWGHQDASLPPTPAWLAGEHLVSGAAAGMFASLLSNPLDVARTRQMCMDIQNPHDAAVLRWDCAPGGRSAGRRSSPIPARPGPRPLC